MAKDPIVDEVRRVRKDLAGRHDFDVKAILAAPRKRQNKSMGKIVSFVREKKFSA